MVRGIAGRRKRYVEVEAEFLADGTVVPRAVAWHDGRRFPVRAVSAAPSSKDGRRMSAPAWVPMGRADGTGAPMGDGIGFR